MPGPYTVPYAGVNPYVAQIAEAIGRQGTIAAQGALARGNAVAEALQGVGQTIATGIQQHQKDVREAPQRRLQQLQVGQAERQVQSQSALADVLKTVPRVRQGGASYYDTQKIADALSERGFGDAVPEALQHLEAVNTAFRQSHAAKQQLYGRLIQGARASNPSNPDDIKPEFVGHVLDVLAENGELTPDQAQHFKTFASAAPGNVQQLLRFVETQYLGPQKPEKYNAGDAGVDPITGQVLFKIDEKPTFGQPQAVVDAKGDAHFVTQGVVGGKPQLFENGQPYAGPPIASLASRPSGSPKTLDVLQAEAYARGDMAEVQRIRGVLSMNKSFERAPQKPEMVFLRQGDQQIAVPVTEANTYLAKGWRKYDAVDSRGEVTREQQNQANARRAGTALDVLGQLVQFEPGKNGQLVATKRHPGFNSVFGVLDGSTWTFRQNTVDAETLLKQLVSLVTQPEMQTLRGLGPASDKDVAIIQAGATTLQNRKLSERAAIQEMQRIYISLSKLKRDAEAKGVSVPGLTDPVQEPAAPSGGGVGQNPFRK